nr:immunoglobulin light chain junction region [Macaca mulatta]MOV81908.1 immunoglobulin light chain junction region [Macaca mulatta]MOX97289.1 immunoglobulin light chain junction region [Macaca mulatta]MOX98100.1 immunoglobulin light chain junction region [Macaca mulatta]MOX98362.1 immunoglobulin light chain junction region [Macaca mulatta]
CMQPREFPWTF